MKVKILFNNLLFLKNLKIVFFKKLNLLLLKSKMGLIFLNLPNYYFFFSNENLIKFIFLNKYKFYSFFKQIFFFYSLFFKIFFFRIKLKGLGYRIKKINKKLLKIFMAYNHFFYFYIPDNIFFWRKKRKLLIISFDKIKLNNLFYQLLILKKMDFYEKTKAFIVPKKILFIKK